VRDERRCSTREIEIFPKRKIGDGGRKVIDWMIKTRVEGEMGDIWRKFFHRWSKKNTKCEMSQEQWKMIDWFAKIKSK